MAEDNRSSQDSVPASGCWECGEAPAPPMAYALGEIGYELPSEARRDGLMQQGLPDPGDPQQLLWYLETHPESAAAVTWTLNQETLPIYAIQPGGAFARATYARLRLLLQQQATGGPERVAVPGWVSGSAQRRGGGRLPILWPEWRGLRCWPAKAPAGAAPAFIERVAYETRNPGLTPPQRAINYAATQALQVERIFHAARDLNLRLDIIAVEPSPICRPAADCWDVKLIFFDPARRLQQARVVYRLTVDVSDVVPVTVGKVRHWEVY